MSNENVAGASLKSPRPARDAKRPNKYTPPGSVLKYQQERKTKKLKGNILHSVDYFIR